MDKHGVMWRPFYALHALLPPVWNETHVLWPKMPQEKLPDVFLSWNNAEAALLYNSSVSHSVVTVRVTRRSWRVCVCDAPGVCVRCSWRVCVL